MDIEKYISNKIEQNYVYFIYSNITNKIYVGETENLSRINIYKEIIEEDNESKRFMLYNFYTKHNLINKKLSIDIVNKYNKFNIFYFRTIYNKHLEKSYIRFLSENGYKLYNTKLYKNHILDENEIDKKIIKQITK